jgi:hypothetical protein
MPSATANMTTTHLPSALESKEAQELMNTLICGFQPAVKAASRAPRALESVEAQDLMQTLFAGFVQNAKIKPVAVPTPPPPPQMAASPRYPVAQVMPAANTAPEYTLENLETLLKADIRRMDAANPVLMRKRQAMAQLRSLRLVQGPLTDDENAKALVEHEKEKMRRYGTARGQNPDFAFAAPNKELFRVRMGWTKVLAGRVMKAQGRVRYVDASNMMRSAAKTTQPAKTSK